MVKGTGMKGSIGWVIAVVAGSQAMMWGIGLLTERIGLAAPTATAPAISRLDEAPRMTVAQLRQRQQDGKAQTVIDLRAAVDYETAHVAGAINVPFELLGRWAADQKPAQKQRPVVLYCACGAEHSSAIGVVLLRNQGFAEAWALKGGWRAWQDGHLPLGRGKQP